MTGFQSKRAFARQRHADDTTVGLVIELTKERNALLDENNLLRNDADFWRDKCISWMQRCAELTDQLDTLRDRVGRENG